MNRILIACFFTLMGVSAWAQPKEIKIEVGGIEIEMVRVDPGSVAVPPRTGYARIKDPATGKYVVSYKDPSTGKYVYPEESTVAIPGNTETISEPFYIFKYPLLNAQWARIALNEQKYMQTGKKATLPYTGSYFDKDNGDRNPENVAWFLEKLNKKTGLQFDLPRLCEWLLACGPVPEDYENYAWTDGSAHPVGQKLPNAIGAYDMLGNVAEMVKQDSYLKGDQMIVEYPRYVGGVPLLGSKYIRKDPSRLLELRTTAPESSMLPPGFRFILKGVPQDCPGKIFTRIFEENGKKGVETEYGVILKPEFDVLQLVEVDPDMAFGNGFAVSRNGKWGVFTRAGKPLLPMIFNSFQDVEKNLPYLEFVSYSYNRREREKEIASTKGEYEKSADFEARMANPALQEAYINAQMEDFEKQFIASVTQNSKTVFILLDYDADREVFRFKVNHIRNMWKEYEIHVPLEDAPAFKAYLQSSDQQKLIQEADWGIVDDSIQLLHVTFTLPDGRSFSF